MLLSACGPAAPATTVAVPPTAVPPTAVPPTAVPPTEVVPTEIATCLIIGATFGGSITDAGYNQAMHEAVMDIKTNIPCVKIIEADNVYDEAGATNTMQSMIDQGAKMIIATASNHQDPAFALSETHPDVIFEDAGGWKTSANFGIFFGSPPDGWYLMGIAAGKMTTSNKIGFVANAPFGWALTFINAFELGVQSVNPDAQTYVTFTQAWGDSAKEAEATNALINQGADVITMFVDSPVTVIGTAENRAGLLDRFPEPGRSAVRARILDLGHLLYPGTDADLADPGSDRWEMGRRSIRDLRYLRWLHGHRPLRPESAPKCAGSGEGETGRDRCRYVGCL